MNNKHFNALSKRYYGNLTAKEIAFIKKVGELFDDYENENQNNVIIGGSVIFTRPDDDKQLEFTWDGEFFT
jgi:hypothetical protein